MMEQPILFHTLDNGIRVVHKAERSAVAYCGFAINVGTRDENENESGMAHFIEHMLFKGTKKRRSWHILNRLESVGGELNAYTTKEETFVYATTLTADFERAMELCADIVFNSVFPDTEIEKEVDVIIEEINSYNDSPSELIFDEFESLMFSDSKLGRNILGDKKRLQQYTTEDALRFVQSNYFTDKILFFSVGDVDEKRVLRLADKYLSGVPSNLSTKVREKSAIYRPSFVRQSRQTHQVHALIGNRAYSLSDPKRLQLYLLNNVLGGPGMNSRLNLNIRERHGLAYSVESSYSAYSDDGIISIYFGTDSDGAERCLSLVHRELKNLRDVGLSTLQLDRARKQLLGQLAISQENRENLSLNMAKSYLFFNMNESLDVVAKRLEQITSRQLLEVANEVFAEDKLSTLIYEE